VSQDHYSDSIKAHNRMNTQNHVLPMYRAESQRAAELSNKGYKCDNCFYYLSKLQSGNCILKRKTVNPYNICHLHIGRVNLNL